jgi:hypothetical protein
VTRKEWHAIVKGLRDQLDDARRRGNDNERQGIAMALEQMMRLAPSDEPAASTKGEVER